MHVLTLEGSMGAPRVGYGSDMSEDDLVWHWQLDTDTDMESSKQMCVEPTQCFSGG